ncbi:MAG: hypothetical protein V4559_11080 [Pseudomonadota bacterium]
MSRKAVAPFAAACLLGLIGPVLALTGSTTGGPSKGASGTLDTLHSVPMHCQGMINEAHPKMDKMAKGSKKTSAMKQIDLANAAMSLGKEKSCMSHMKRAMHNM